MLSATSTTRTSSLTRNRSNKPFTHLRTSIFQVYVMVSLVESSTRARGITSISTSKRKVTRLYRSITSSRTVPSSKTRQSKLQLDDPSWAWSCLRNSIRRVALPESCRSLYYRSRMGMAEYESCPHPPSKSTFIVRSLLSASPRLARWS